MAKDSLNLYRRHTKDCRGGHPRGAFSGETEERRKGWKRCDCPINVSGTVAGKFIRKSTGKALWEEARLVALTWEEAPSTASSPQSSTPAVESGLVEKTIEDAVTAFLNSHRESSHNTRRQYKYRMNNLKAYAESRGYTLMRQWRSADIRELSESWDVTSNTRTKNMIPIKTFFKYCQSMEWIEKNPTVNVTQPRNRALKEQTERIPFTDDELKRMYAACDRYVKPGQEWRYNWTGQDLADFISISVYTGLRISDVATFRREHMNESGEVRVRTTKMGRAGRDVYTWVPEWLQERIKERARIYGPDIFGKHNTDNINNITDQWRKRLKALWKTCGKWSETPTHHRFRHTFARILLQKPNLTVRDVAELLGNTEAVVRRHYAAWIQERQDRLTLVLQDAFKDKPMPGRVLPFRAS